MVVIPTFCMPGLMLTSGSAFIQPGWFPNFHFLRNVNFNLYISLCKRNIALRGPCYHTNCNSLTHWRVNCLNYFEVVLNSVHALELFRRGIRTGAACLYRLNWQLGTLYNYNPRMISAAQKNIIRIFSHFYSPFGGGVVTWNGLTLLRFASFVSMICFTLCEAVVGSILSPSFSSGHHHDWL